MGTSCAVSHGQHVHNESHCQAPGQGADGWAGPLPASVLESGMLCQSPWPPHAKEGRGRERALGFAGTWLGTSGSREGHEKPKGILEQEKWYRDPRGNARPSGQNLLRHLCAALVFKVRVWVCWEVLEGCVSASPEAQGVDTEMPLTQ